MPKNQMPVTLKVTKPKKERKKRAPKAWVEETTTIDKVKLTDPELIFVNICKLRYPSLHKALLRSNVPYKGTNYKSDFVIFEDRHPFWHGMVCELQGGIFQDRRTGHSSASGLIRDYKKTFTAQMNHWFIVQIPPDPDLISDYVDLIYDQLQTWKEESEENDRLLSEWES